MSQSTWCARRHWMPISRLEVRRVNIQQFSYKKLIIRSKSFHKKLKNPRHVFSTMRNRTRRGTVLATGESARIPVGRHCDVSQLPGPEVCTQRRSCHASHLFWSNVSNYMKWGHISGLSGWHRGGWTLFLLERSTSDKSVGQRILQIM